MVPAKPIICLSHSPGRRPRPDAAGHSIHRSCGKPIGHPPGYIPTRVLHRGKAPVKDKCLGRRGIGLSTRKCIGAWILAGGSALLLSACADSPEPVIGAAATQPVAELGQSDYAWTRSRTYLLRPSDKISVNVFREPDFSLDTVQIGVEGNISMPMLGSIPAAGMSAEALEDDITARLARVGLKSPAVAVNIAEYASHLVTVEGAVREPGVYSFQPGARLSSAIALASGPERTAKTTQVAVFRETAQGVAVAKFDYAMMSEGTMLDPVLEPGDRVVMGTDGLSVFWQDFIRAVPVFGIFATAGSSF